MVQRKFFRYREVGDQLGDVEAVRQAIMLGNFPTFVELRDDSCTVRSKTGEFPKDGFGPYANWFSVMFNDEPPRVIADGGPLAGWFERDYILRGWFRVADHSAAEVARSNGESAFYVDVFGERDDATCEKFHLEEPVALNDLWFRPIDIAAPAVVNAASASKTSLDSRERTTLLCIIGALAENAKIDLTKPMKAGNIIAAMMHGVKLSGRTIGEHLKDVPDAMDRLKI